MLKWLYEIVLALCCKRVMGISFFQALRFVRCDFLIQKQISQDLGITEDNPGKDDSNDKESD